MKTRKILVLILIILSVIISTFVIFKIDITSSNPGHCGDGVCNVDETHESCVVDCSCHDSTFDESIGEWGSCNGGYRKRIIQNSCGETKVETEICVVESTSNQEFVIEANGFIRKIEDLNKEITASINAYNDGLMSSVILKERVENIGTKNLVLYYDLKRLEAPSQYSSANILLKQAIAAQLTGVNELLEYFIDVDVTHIYTAQDWIIKSEEYVSSASSRLR